VRARQAANPCRTWPALSDLPVRKVTRALESAGFAYVRTKGSHAVYRSSGGRVVVIPEHGTIKRGTPGQAALTPADFLKLLD
jgi:predicted RNA binding protein YcfA (HicA-like mRNA interferase family)